MKESNNMQAWQDSSYLAGVNAAYLEELYEAFLHDPQSVPPNWRSYFANLAAEGRDVSHADIREHFRELAKHTVVNAFVPQATNVGAVSDKQIQVLRLMDAYRSHGHYRAQIDPLSLMPKIAVPELELSFYGLTKSDLNTVFNAYGACGLQTAPLKDICAALEQTYCGVIGFEYTYISDSKQVAWLRERIEAVRAKPNISVEKKRHILRQLTYAEGLERFLGSKYVGQTRFSVEGGDSLMPLLDELVQRASSDEVKEIVIGMGHRGRLNVLVNTFGKALTELSQEFEGKHINHEGSGDVKYHLGVSADIETPKGIVHLALAFNPSHLEIIDPVVEGSVRARQHRRNDTTRSQVIPLLIHGDAAFAGQGVVMETLNLSQTRGFSTGGTFHIIVNNQIGFTISNPKDARSTWYCTDVAKMIEVPIFHVNADDPEAVVFVAQLALDFRATFKKDVVVDLVCYRRHGHNEGDEPSATQPVMYQKIKQLPTTRSLYADRLIAEGVVTAAEVDSLITQCRDELDKGHSLIKTVNGKNHDKYAINWAPYLNQNWTAPANTGFPLAQLKSLAQTIETLPSGFTLQPQVAKMMDERRKITTGEVAVNWGYAETMAFATLLSEGYPIRLTGQDSGRGTFAHRHAVLHDFQNDTIYIPLEKVAKQPATMTIVDSVLSEEAVVAFEYGYATASPETLVIWEAQYGDFVNGAQVVIDQFISSGEQKWGRLSGLTLFLPHGYEGAGPEHSSARLERFLQLCAEHNMQVCVPSTPAQVFHMIRRQMLRPFRKPLIVLTPKSMLRHKLATSTLQELAVGQFQLIIPEVDNIKPAQVRRVILCSGKLYYDLLEQRRASKKEDIALIRIEQLYPFPTDELTAELQQYKKTKDVIWCQEEPKNQGAWYSTQHHILACLAKGQTLEYIGRDASASPATGAKLLHVEQQKALLAAALK